MGKVIKRKDDWVEQLEGFVKKHAQTDFKYGEIDCALYVCDAIEAMTGVDVAESFRGLYKTKNGALKVLKEYGGLEGIGDFVSRGYGMRDVKANFEGRGDVVLFVYEGVKSFGFISLSGREVCGLSESGNTSIPRKKLTIISAWSFA